MKKSRMFYLFGAVFAIVALVVIVSILRQPKPPTIHISPWVFVEEKDVQAVLNTLGYKGIEEVYIHPAGAESYLHHGGTFLELYVSTSEFLPGTAYEKYDVPAAHSTIVHQLLLNGPGFYYLDKVTPKEAFDNTEPYRSSGTAYGGASADNNIPIEVLYFFGEREDANMAERSEMREVETDRLFSTYGVFFLIIAAVLLFCWFVISLFNKDQNARLEHQRSRAEFAEKSLRDHS